MINVRRLFFVLGCLLIPALAGAMPIGYYLCRDARDYLCYTVKRHDSWENLFDSSHERDLVMRINRMNTPLYPGLRIAIPKDVDGDISSFSPFPSQITPPRVKMIYVSINPLVLAWGAYDSQGHLVAWGPAVGARGYCPDIHRGCHTTLGTFHIYRKEGPGCVSSRFPVPRGGAPMPWCMYFHGGFALHGSFEVPGYNASHGCVRMFVPDAEWLNQDFTAGDPGVAVIISNKE